MLSILFSNPEIYKMVYEQNQKFKSDANKGFNFNSDTKIFDIKDGFIIKKLVDCGYYLLADICITLVCFIDEVVVHNGPTGKICVIYLAVNEIDYNFRFKVSIFSLFIYF